MIVLLGGTHGNELAAVQYLTTLVNQPLSHWLLLQRPPPTRGATFVIVPAVNEAAIGRRKRRGADGVDVNRAWPCAHAITRRLAPYIERADLVVDFHESHLVGSPYAHSLTWAGSAPQAAAFDLRGLVANLNRLTSPRRCGDAAAARRKPPWHFAQTVAPPGSLRAWCGSLGVPYLLVETSSRCCSWTLRQCQIDTIWHHVNQSIARLLSIEKKRWPPSSSLA